MARCFGWGNPRTLPLEPTNVFNGLEGLFTPKDSMTKKRCLGAVAGDSQGISHLQLFACRHVTIYNNEKWIHCNKPCPNIYTTSTPVRRPRLASRWMESHVCSRATTCVLYVYAVPVRTVRCIIIPAALRVFFFILLFIGLFSRILSITG